MLRFFRINDPYRLVFIFFAMIIIRVVQGHFIDGIAYFELKWLLLGEWLAQGFKMYSETFDYSGPLSAFVYKYLHLLLGRSSFIHYGFSTLLIIYQAAIFNQLLLRNKAYDENSYLPAFLYMILMVSVPDFMALSPQLMSLTFVLLSLRFVLRRIDNQATDEIFLNAGLYLGVASMLYLPAAVFFVAFLFALILFSSAVTRRLVLYLFGFLMSLALAVLYFYWRGDLEVFIDSYLIQNLKLRVESPMNLTRVFSVCAGFVFVFVLSVMKTWSAARLTNFQLKIQQVFWFMLLGGASTFLLSNEKSLHEMVYLVPAISYFWVHYFILLKKKVFRYVMPGVMIFGLLLHSIYNYVQTVDPLKVEARDEHKKVMVLGDDLGYYINQTMRTPCFNNQLSLRAFEGLDYYQKASTIYLIFERTNPEVIIDHLEVMPSIQGRFPKIDRSFRAVEKGVYHRQE